jgi:shikimate dehydrogenase
MCGGGLNYLYKAFTTTDLKSAIAGIRALAIRGCAISMSFKEEVMQYLDHIDPSAARIHAVNTIVNDDGVLRGFNTDYTAIHKIVNERAVPLSACICVFGSGGMAQGDRLRAGRSEIQSSQHRRAQRENRRHVGREIWLSMVP